MRNPKTSAIVEDIDDEDVPYDEDEEVEDDVDEDDEDDEEDEDDDPVRLASFGPASTCCANDLCS